MAVQPIPEGYHSITPNLIVEGVAELIDFLKRAFEAELEGDTMTMPDGTVAHAELRIGDSKVMLGEATAEWAPMPGSFYLYVEDVDAVYERALQAGGTSLREPIDEFYGDRSGGVEDPSGNQWWVATHVEDVSPEEMERRAEAWAKEKAEG